MKPLGISLFVNGDGPSMRCVTPSPVEDAVWDAVEAAIQAGWTPQRFKSEAAAAWEHELKDQAEQARKELSKP